MLILLIMQTQKGATMTLKDFRLKKGYTRYQLAKKLLVTETAIYKWESGKVIPHEGNRQRLQELLDLPSSFFDKND